MSNLSNSNGFRLASTAVRSFFMLTLVLGIVYPVALFGIGRIMAAKADGSIITNSDGQPVGSSLIAQEVTQPGFFYPRPSAAGDSGFNAMSSSATNLSPFSDELAQAIEEKRSEIAQREHVSPDQVPADAVTSSGSGLDPHISTRYAKLQAPRVAQERDIDQSQVEQMISEATETDLAGSTDGAPVNVVMLNQALSELRELR